MKNLKSLYIGAVLTVLFSILVTGCATGKNFDDSKLSKVKTGVTTESEVVQLFGQPERTVSSDDGSFTYYYSHLVSYAGYGKGSYKSMAIVFDKNRVVQKHQLNK